MVAASQCCPDGDGVGVELSAEVCESERVGATCDGGESLVLEVCRDVLSGGGERKSHWLVGAKVLKGSRYRVGVEDLAKN